MGLNLKKEEENKQNKKRETKRTKITFLRFRSEQNAIILSELSNYRIQITDNLQHRTVLTKYSEVDHVLPVARGKSSVLADVGGFIGQLQVGEHDGGVFQRRHTVTNCRLLEGDPLLEGGQDRHAESRVGYGHILLGAIEELLPGDLRDLDRRVTVDENAAQFHLRTHKARLTGVHLYHLPIAS